MYGKRPRFSIMRQTDDWLDSSGNRVHLSFLKLAETAASGRLGLEEVRKRFIDQMGTHMETEGLPRIAGRLFGLMILELEPISFGDLAHRLGVSRGSISTNSRLIEAKGLIERVSMEGERVYSTTQNVNADSQLVDVQINNLADEVEESVEVKTVDLTTDTAEVIDW